MGRENIKAGIGSSIIATMRVAKFFSGAMIVCAVCVLVPMFGCYHELRDKKQEAYTEAVRYITTTKYLGVNELLPFEKTVIIPVSENKFTVRLMMRSYDSFGRKSWAPFHATVQKDSYGWKCLGVERMYEPAY